MSETLSIVVSIFGLIGLGYFAARTGFLSEAVAAGLTDFVFTLAIPLLLFQTLAAADLHGLSPWRIWAAYFTPFAIVWFLSHQMIRRVFGRDARAGVVAGGSAAYSNSVLIGLPLLQAALGDKGTVYLVVIVAIHTPILMLLSVFLNEWALAVDGASGEASSRREALKRVAIAMVRHPILIGIFAGLLWRVTGFAIPEVAAKVIGPLARSAGPLALFASGMALVNYGIARQVKPAVAITALKLLLMPSLAYAMSRFLGLPPIGVAALTLAGSCPTGVNVFLLSTRLGTGEALASNTLVISTAASVFTVALWLTLLQTLTG